MRSKCHLSICMTSAFLILCVVSCGFVSSEELNIIPSQRTLCPVKPCFTFSQLVAKASNMDTITLILFPGNHSLNLELTFSNVKKFAMFTNFTLSSRSTIIICDLQWPARFKFSTLVIYILKA